MTTVQLGTATVDLDTGAVTGGPQPLVLSQRERALLGRLVQAGGTLVPRDCLGGGQNSRAADMAVSRSRKRLGTNGDAILTVRGRGYRLDLGPNDEGLDLGWGRLELGSLRVVLPDRSVAITARQGGLLARLAEDPGRPGGQGRAFGSGSRS